MKSFVILVLALSSVAFADQTVPAAQQTQVQQVQESAAVNPSAKKAAKKHKKHKKATPAKPAEAPAPAQAPVTTTQQ